MYKLLYFFLVSLLLVSCKKDLDFEYHKINPILVIEGQLSQNGCEVRLTNTTPMNEYMDTTHLTDACILLKDLSDGTSRELVCGADGIFKDYNPGIIEHSYELEIIHNENNYTSSCKMRQSTEITNLEFSWLKMPYDYVAILEIKFKEIPSKETYYWIKIYRNNEAYQWLTCDNRSAVEGEITQMTMTSRKDLSKEDEKDILRDGDVIKVDISNISKEMYDYLSALKISSNGPLMFQGEFCLGYFLASDIVSHTIIYNPDELKER